MGQQRYKKERDETNIKQMFWYVKGGIFKGRDSDQGWKNILPGKFFGGVGVLFIQGVGKRDFAKIFLQILLMDQAGDLDLGFQD
jgi:hypothetical protein